MTVSIAPSKVELLKAAALASLAAPLMDVAGPGTPVGGLAANVPSGEPPPGESEDKLTPAASAVEITGALAAGEPSAFGVCRSNSVPMRNPRKSVRDGNR